MLNRSLFPELKVGLRGILLLLLHFLSLYCLILTISSRFLDCRSRHLIPALSFMPASHSPAIRNGEPVYHKGSICLSFPHCPSSLRQASPFWVGDSAQLPVSLPTAKTTQLLPLSAEDPAQCPTGVIPGVAVVGAHVIDLMPCRGRQLPWGSQH